MMIKIKELAEFNAKTQSTWAFSMILLLDAARADAADWKGAEEMTSCKSSVSSSESRKCGSAPYSQETPESGETARLHSVPIPWPLLSTRATVATRCCCSLLLFLTHWPTALAATPRRACAVSTDVPRLRGVRSLTEWADEAVWLPASAAEADQIKSPITIEFNWESIARGIPSRGHLRRSARRRRP